MSVSYVYICLFTFMHVQFAQLINTCRKLGPEKFPLIEQTFYPNYKEMVRTTSSPPLLLHKLKMFLFVIDIKKTLLMCEGIT